MLPANYTGKVDDKDIFEMSMDGIVMRAMFNNHSKELGRVETRLGRDEDYWVEMDDFREGMLAIDRVFNLLLCELFFVTQLIFAMYVAVAFFCQIMRVNLRCLSKSGTKKIRK